MRAMKRQLLQMTNSAPFVWMSGLAAAFVLMMGGGALSGCATESPPLSPETMTAVLVDLHLSEVRSEVSDDARPVPRDTVLAWHDVSPATFEAAEAHYTDHPSAYRDVYEAVVDSLQGVRDDVGAWEAAQQEEEPENGEQDETEAPDDTTSREHASDAVSSTRLP